MFEVQRGNTIKPLWIYHPKCAQDKLPKGRMLQVVRHGYGFEQTAGEFKRQKKDRILVSSKHSSCELQQLLLAAFWHFLSSTAFPSHSGPQTAHNFLL